MPPTEDKCEISVWCKWSYKNRKQFEYIPVREILVHSVLLHQISLFPMPYLLCNSVKNSVRVYHIIAMNEEKCK